MKRKDYMKPHMEVIELKTKSALLVDSALGTDIKSSNAEDEYEVL